MEVCLLSINEDSMVGVEWLKEKNRSWSYWVGGGLGYIKYYEWL